MGVAHAALRHEKASNEASTEEALRMSDSACCKRDQGLPAERSAGSFAASSLSGLNVRSAKGDFRYSHVLNAHEERRSFAARGFASNNEREKLIIHFRGFELLTC